MKFEKPSQAAKRLGITARAIQKWANDGRIPGAYKLAGQWMVPADFTEPAKKNSAQITSVTESFRAPASIINAEFEPGKCLEYIESVKDENERRLMYAEYCYYRGECEKASEIAEEYLESSDVFLKSTACVVYFYANLSRGHVHLAKFALAVLQKGVKREEGYAKIPELHSLKVFTSHLATVIGRVSSEDLEPLENWIKYLPGGMKLFSCYIVAHNMVKLSKFQGAHAVAKISVELTLQSYVLSEIYCKIIDTVALVNMRMVDEAQKQFMSAWELAKKDGFIEPFAEHYLILCGLIERCLKNTSPDDYKRITDSAEVFANKCLKLNLGIEDDSVPELSVTEFSVAMLYTKEWSPKEIAYHLDMSVRTVYRHISNIYATLGIGSVAELRKYMQN